MISRRGLLLGAGAAAGVAGIVGLRFAFAKPEMVIADVVRKRLDYLKLDQTGVDEFANDLASRNYVATTKLRALSAIGFTEVPVEQVGVHWQALRHGEERIVTYYLLSSDFFQNGSDETREVLYLGFYDPFRSACMNPFPSAEAEAAG